ncbi:MAG: iron ABC transporter permease [Acidimicrobiales bacterium]
MDLTDKEIAASAELTLRRGGRFAPPFTERVAAPIRDFIAAPPTPVRRVTGFLSRGGRPLFWILIALFILAPCACFLVIAVSPRLFDEGHQWFTLSYLKNAFNGTTGVALFDSIWVSCSAAALGLLVGFPIAWISSRTNLPGRRFVSAGMWVVLLLPSWLPAIGWIRVVQIDGVMYRLGIGSPFITHAILGPFGIVLILGLRNVPFTYLAITAALQGLGEEFEDAARVHGAGRFGAIRLVAPIIAPAITSALAIGFAEAVSDFGVASTIAYQANFPIATYQLYQDIGNFPPSFPGAAASAWPLVASVALPLALQARALRGRSYAVLSGRTRAITRRSLTRWGGVGVISGIAAYFVVALGIPGFGAISASLLADYGASFSFTTANFHAVFANSGLSGPLERSLVYGAVTATITVVFGFIAARMLSKARTKATRLLDFLLLAAVALPSVVFGAGYIFAYNLPFLNKIGLDLYQTTTLLIVGYIASSLPTNARVLVGSVSQVQSSLHDAARAHGAGPIIAWARGVLPVVSRPIVMAWILTFAGIFLELPLSQLLYAPNNPPASVAIQDNLGNYHYGIGMAQSVLAVAAALICVAIVLGAYRLLAPEGWRRTARAASA